MKSEYILIAIFMTMFSIPLTSNGQNKTPEKMSIFNFELRSITTESDKPVKLSQYKGNVILLVNTATECGLAPQYTKLQDLYMKYHDKGFEILSFPSNSFNQEPRTDDEIIKFCHVNFHVSFPTFMKIDVKGPNIHPLYRFLTDPETDPQFPGEIKWNFEKFLIDRNGKIIGRFEPKMEPDNPKIITAIEKAL
jgi:glutathione peroxidase